MSASTMTITPPLGRLDEKCTSLGSRILANARRMFKMGRWGGDGDNYLRKYYLGMMEEIM